MKIRIKFGKEGELRFIGHLDIMHYFQKALRRAGIPVCYSAGFSPHQIMSFALPLSVGQTSEGEYMDIEVSDSGSSAEMTERLNRVMVEGAHVYSWRRLKDDAENAMASIAAADYRISFRPGYEPENWEQFSREFIAFCGKDTIPVEKKSKKNVRQVDIRPLIYRAEAGDRQIDLRVASGSVNHLNPELIFRAFYQSRGQELPPFALLIHRREMFADLTNEGGHRLVPLEELGEDIG